jgi:ribosomal protein S18 acetylase RimI-like enzyme
MDRQPLTSNLRIVSEPRASEADIAFVKNALYEFNMVTMKDHSPKPINLFVRDDSDVIYGGLLINCWGKWAHVDFLWVSEQARHHGFGSRLMEMGHEQARGTGCIGAYLETFSFQARPFYERFGYEVVGEVKGYPPGQTYFFMAKTPL